MTNQNLYGHITEAADFVGATLRHRDADETKWNEYLDLRNYEERLAWSLKVGHAEFCRLQRLSFHCFI